MSEINNYLDYINSCAKNDPEGLIFRSESRFKNIITSVAQRAVSSQGHTAIMLSGPSASGKTTTAGKIAEALRAQGVNAFTISLDDFYKNKEDAALLEDGTPDLESVHALDIDLISSTLNRIIETGESELPVFDFSTGKRSEKKGYIKLEKDDVIIVEGLHALNPLVNENLPEGKTLKIYISVSSRIYGENQKIILNKRNLRFTRRLVRDFQFRSSSVENTYSLWPAVLRGEDLFLAPYKLNSDIQINSIHIYEPCVLKQIALPLLYESIKNDNSFFEEDARKLIRGLESFETIPASMVPEFSLLREFLGKN